MADIKLYPHNQETYAKIQEMWKITNRVAAVQATGTGKSFLILKCLFDIPNDNKVVLAPTEYIFEQLKDNVDDDIPNTQFITYAKLTYMTEEAIKELNPSLIVLDEFHRCGAEEWGRGIQILLNTFPDVKVLGTSATPIRYLDNERDMSDELFNGNVAINLPLVEAIIKDILPMPKYISALYTFEDEVENLKNKVINSHNSDEEKDEYLDQIEMMRNKLNKSKGIPKILQKHLIQSNGKFIIFCKNKDHLYEMKTTVVNWFKKAKINNKIDSYIVYTGYKYTDRDFEAFKNNDSDSLKLLFSIEMLNEGLHINDVTGVILLRPTSSPIIYYQQIGRAIDASGSKEPLIFDFVNNFDNLGATQFIDDLNKYREKEIRNRKNSNRENIDIPEFVIWDEIKEVKNMFSNIENQLMHYWDSMYNQLEKYYEENGNTDVPQTYPALGIWVNGQRKNYKSQILGQEKIDRLNLLNFSWTILDIQWDKMFNELVSHYNKYNNFEIKNNVKLKTWIINQRSRYKSNTLDIYKIEKLNSIGFIWSMFDYDWNEMFLLLLDYELEYGDLLVPAKFIYKNKKLGSWVSGQRADYKRDRLKEYKIQKLNNIHFMWDFDKEEINIYHIKNLLKKHNMNQKELSEIIGFKHSSAVSAWCSNKRVIQEKYLKVLSKIFNIDSNLIEPQERD